VEYICTNSDDKKVKQDMYAAIPYFQDSHDCYGCEQWGKSSWKIL